MIGSIRPHVTQSGSLAVGDQTMLRALRLQSHNAASTRCMLRSAGRSWLRRPLTAQAQAEASAPAEGQQLSKRQQKKQQQQQNQKQQGGKGGGSGSAVTPRSTDFSRWYLDVVREAELADYGPVRGTMVIRPYGYALWEALQQYLNGRFKEYGVQNAYFPQLIPLSFLQKEADHVEGFAPELAIVTQGGGKELEEPLVVRPTSESIVNHMLSDWIRSYRDLPMRLNQWANVHRWEMRTRPFIRTLEFLWQEGHTAHATAEEAEAEARRFIGVYRDFAVDMAAIPVIAGRKSRTESFAGAKVTYTIEGMMGDGRALQAGTSHHLGDNFARAFNTQFLDEAGNQVYAQQSSWGMSTRMVGGVIMTHGDDAGLRLPPRMAPIQVVIVPIVKGDADREAVLDSARALHEAAAQVGIRAHLDADEGRTPGWKFNFWEMKGVPLRVEVGPKDVAAAACVVARRDRPGREGKTFGVPAQPAAFVEALRAQLEEVQAGLLEQATQHRDANIVDVASVDELRAAIEAGSDEDERAVKEATTATLRCFPFEQPATVGRCFFTGAETGAEVAIFAKAY